MEMADIVVIIKDDGENRASVAITRHMYESAHILRRSTPRGSRARFELQRAGAARGIEAVWPAGYPDFKTNLTDSGDLEKLRQRQAPERLQKQTENRGCICRLPERTLIATSSKRYRWRKTRPPRRAPACGRLANSSRIITCIKGIVMSYQYVNVTKYPEGCGD